MNAKQTKTAARVKFASRSISLSPLSDHEPPRCGNTSSCIGDTWQFEATRKAERVLVLPVQRKKVSTDSSLRCLDASHKKYCPGCRLFRRPTWTHTRLEHDKAAATWEGVCFFGLFQVLPCRCCMPTDLRLSYWTGAGMRCFQVSSRRLPHVQTYLQLWSNLTFCLPIVGSGTALWAPLLRCRKLVGALCAVQAWSGLRCTPALLPLWRQATSPIFLSFQVETIADSRPRPMRVKYRVIPCKTDRPVYCETDTNVQMLQEHKCERSHRR